MTGRTQGAVAVMGGTFDPIHHGHLRSALELVQRLPVDRLHLIPCHQPPHRAEPGVSSQHRLAMVRLAVEGEERLVADGRELEREGPSYTVDTLASLRSELGPERPLLLVVGTDALLGLDRWHRWQELFRLAHLVILKRPGWCWSEKHSLRHWLEARRTADAVGLLAVPAGRVFWLQQTPLAISATEVRQLIGAGLSPRYLIPDAVLDYIRQHGLYR